MYSVRPVLREPGTESRRGELAPPEVGLEYLRDSYRYSYRCPFRQLKPVEEATPGWVTSLDLPRSIMLAAGTMKQTQPP